jgi:hypothetical protein
MTNCKRFLSFSSSVSLEAGPGGSDRGPGPARVLSLHSEPRLTAASVSARATSVNDPLPRGGGSGVRQMRSARPHWSFTSSAVGPRGTG